MVYIHYFDVMVSHAIFKKILWISSKISKEIIYKIKEIQKSNNDFFNAVLLHFYGLKITKFNKNLVVQSKFGHGAQSNFF